MAYICIIQLTPAEKQQFHEIFSQKTVKLDTCTIWLAPKTSAAYAMIHTHFRGKRMKLLAHRLLFSCTILMWPCQKIYTCCIYVTIKHAEKFCIYLWKLHPLIINDKFVATWVSVQDIMAVQSAYCKVIITNYLQFFHFTVCFHFF
jgi:hypothetical protein